MSLNRDLTLIFAISCVATLIVARDLPSTHSESLEARLAVGLEDETAGLVDCWNAMRQLRSCSDEVVLFFANGETHLGMGCCRAIRTVTRRCWPSMLASVGISAEEGGILRGFCDAETAAVAPSAAAPPAA